MTGEVGTNLEYAPYVHQGTGIYAVNGDGRKTPWAYEDSKGVKHWTVGQKPNPFLERAFEECRTQIKDIFSENLKRGLQ